MRLNLGSGVPQGLLAPGHAGRLRRDFSGRHRAADRGVKGDDLLPVALLPTGLLPVGLLPVDSFERGPVIKGGPGAGVFPPPAPHRKPIET